MAFDAFGSGIVATNLFFLFLGTYQDCVASASRKSQISCSLMHHTHPVCGAPACISRVPGVVLRPVLTSIQIHSQVARVVDKLKRNAPRMDWAQRAHKYCSPSCVSCLPSEQHSISSQVNEGSAVPYLTQSW